MMMCTLMFNTIQSTSVENSLHSMTYKPIVLFLIRRYHYEFKLKVVNLTLR